MNNTISPNTNAKYNTSFAIIVFLFFFVFYSTIHPLIPIDLDDWSYIVKNRIFLPMWGAWNPAKVFPEFFYPLISAIGSFVIYPINNDFLQSQCIIHSIVVSIFITGYVLSFHHFIRSRFSISTSTAYMISLLFLMLHFLIFRTEETNNIYMFYANDVNCYYNYIIPDLLCASLVLSLLSNDWLKKECQPTLKHAILIVLIYLAICSNLYCSIILGGFIIGDLTLNLICCVRMDKKYYHYLTQNVKKLVIVSCWMLVHIFEAFGLRAKASSDSQRTFFASIQTTLSHFTDIHISKVFILLVLISVAFLFVFIIRKKHEMVAILYQVVLTFSICLVYIVLLSSKVSPEYVLSNNGNFPFFFYLILFVCVVIAIILQEHAKFNLFLPFTILLFYSFINRTSNTFCDIWNQYDYKTLYELTRNNVNNIICADKNNVNNLEIIIPKFNNLDNWPLKMDLDYSNALYKHGIIKSYVKVKLLKGSNISEWNNTQSYEN